MSNKLDSLIKRIKYILDDNRKMISGYRITFEKRRDKYDRIVEMMIITTQVEDK